MKSLPSALRRFLINFIPSQPLHEPRDLVDLTDSTAAQLVKDRKMAQESGKLDGDDEGKDIMSLLGGSRYFNLRAGFLTTRS
jgi:hypothetical protein